MIVWEEILVANGSTVLMMCFLLICRHKNRESLHAEDRLYDAMALVNLLGASLETISFWVDGRAFPGGRAINYISNSICFFCTVSIALVDKINRRAFMPAWNIFPIWFFYNCSNDLMVTICCFFR